jgi:hypothetical protein
VTTRRVIHTSTGASIEQSSATARTRYVTVCEHPHRECASALSGLQQPRGCVRTGGFLREDFEEELTSVLDRAL